MTSTSVAMQVISVCNRKGAGKTTTSVNLAGELAMCLTQLLA